MLWIKSDDKALNKFELTLEKEEKNLYPATNTSYI